MQAFASSNHTPHRSRILGAPLSAVQLELWALGTCSPLDSTPPTTVYKINARHAHRTNTTCAGLCKLKAYPSQVLDPGRATERCAVGALGAWNVFSSGQHPPTTVYKMNACHAHRTQTTCAGFASSKHTPQRSWILGAPLSAVRLELRALGKCSLLHSTPPAGHHNGIQMNARHAHRSQTTCAGLCKLKSYPS